jgi:hypothetical protein
VSLDFPASSGLSNPFCGQQKKQGTLASELGEPAISFKPLLSGIPFPVAHLPFPFRLAVPDDYQFKHGNGGRTSALFPHKRIVSLDLACKS